MPPQDRVGSGGIGAHDAKIMKILKIVICVGMAAAFALGLVSF